MGEVWRSKAVLVVKVVNSGWCRDPGMMQTINSYYSIVEVSVQAVHIPARLNVWADAISRDNLQVFHMQVLEAHARSSPVCQTLMGLLVHQQPDWTSHMAQ